MIRREFLVRTLSAAVASLVARGAFAQNAPHDMHDMSGMQDMKGMEGMGSMPGMSSHASAATHATATLAPADALPAGRPLAALRVLANESREPGVFRATLVAHPVQREMLAGKPTTFWQYDAMNGGALPAANASQGPVVGPLIDVCEGDTVEIRFINRLAQPSTIHWHGLPVPPDQDGNPADPVAPGATRVYRFTLPAGSAGTYWYHPHPHMMSAEQVFRGLAGPIVVRAAADPLAAWPERHLFFSDLRLASDGSIPPNDMMDWMNGREGQFVLVNGARRPRIVVTNDERWRVWNGCNARYLKLSLGAASFVQVGTDGGLLEAPRDGLTELLLAPGERAELIVRAGAGSRQAVLSAAVYDRRKMSMSEGDSLPADPARALADVSFEPPEKNAQAPRALPAKLAVIAPLVASTVRKSVVFSEKMDMSAMHRPGASAHGMPAGMTFMINGSTFDPARVTLTSRRDEVEIWSIENRTDMDHPFHLHGTQFQIIERQSGGVTTPEPYRAWRDTVNVQPEETVRIATVQHMAGERMFHCHILEHEDLGMMGTLRVV
ncbi:multicopper oxidase family protein [Paraburkholderia megapolitana]|uniref:Bilirubin oxidase n=1 Tax=Paraburkholderia megapolitana TaxID=420953 RepID=A0A1I3ILI6_9BURK|nr:multicopper oxidase family protein [Paraburkholderia megapolitana]QDQ85143.1 multicopper oxidase family protein [Paraburkholderia megapolitana]SFI48697.1 bilirubin oxidase [Paraburkholderia megapolitana]